MEARLEFSTGNGNARYQPAAHSVDWCDRLPSEGIASPAPSTHPMGTVGRTSNGASPATVSTTAGDFALAGGCVIRREVSVDVTAEIAAGVAAVGPMAFGATTIVLGGMSLSRNSVAESKH